jgi:putative ABC transport system permease protein
LARSSDTGDDFVLPGMFGGAVLLFLGASLLSPLLTRPLAGLIGRALSWGVSGRLGVRNVLRSPRRTAVTAAPLMIGVTLVGAASVVAQSFTVSIHHAVNETLGARVIVQTDLQGVPGETGFAESAADRVRRVPGVKTFLPLWVSRKTHARGATAPFGGTFATDDLATVRSMFNLAPTAGTLDRLGAGEFATDDTTARTRGWHVGDTVGLVSDVGEERQYRLIGLYKATPIWTDTMILPKAAVVDFAGPLAYQGYVRVDDGADVAAVRRQVEQIMRQYPLVTVGDLDDLLKQYTGAINAVLTVVTLLLLVTILVALLGIINTLLLSTYERIRELGVLRAVGLTRGGTRLMVSIESVVLALFGCVLGVVLGVGLGLALSAALVKRDFLSVIAVPWGTLVTFIILAVVAGVLASLWPAARAGRLNLLRALAHE